MAYKINDTIKSLKNGKKTLAIEIALDILKKLTQNIKNLNNL